MWITKVTCSTLGSSSTSEEIQLYIKWTKVNTNMLGTIHQTLLPAVGASGSLQLYSSHFPLSSVSSNGLSTLVKILSMSHVHLRWSIPICMYPVHFHSIQVLASQLDLPVFFYPSLSPLNKYSFCIYSCIQLYLDVPFINC